MSKLNKKDDIPQVTGSFNYIGEKFSDSENSAVNNFKITYLPLENNSVSKLDGGCYIKDEYSGKSIINMKDISVFLRAK